MQRAHFSLSSLLFDVYFPIQPKTSCAPLVKMKP